MALQAWNEYVPSLQLLIETAGFAFVIWTARRVSASADGLFEAAKKVKTVQDAAIRWRKKRRGSHDPSSISPLGSVEEYEDCYEDPDSVSIPID